MRNLPFLLLISIISLLSIQCTSNVKYDYPVKPVPFTAVQVDDNFWNKILETISRTTIPACFKRCEETGRIDNFAIAGGLKDGVYRGKRYNDSDLFKVIEGASYLLHVSPDPELDLYLDDVIAKIAAAQEDDGYLSTLRTVNPQLDINKTRETTQEQLDMYGDERWSRTDHGHELYCAGHMYEAAVAHYQATGKRSLLNVAIKNADLICETFGSGDGQIRDVPGHQEIELALIKLYRVTGKKKYLDTAKFFLDERGHYNERIVHSHEGSITYCQDDKPVIEQTEPHGHVVRAAYLYSGMADIAAITSDESYIKALDKIWQNIVSKRMYLIGSMGVHGYLEGFAPDYKLPNLEAYNETCATIGSAFVNQRLFLLHKDAKYIDVLERGLYNGIISGVSLQGDKFFYTNTMSSDGKDRERARYKHTRSPWFETACCPSNIARFMPSLPGYIYAHEKDDLYINLYIGSSANINMEKRTVNLIQKTDYPWSGKIDITVNPDQAVEFSIMVRIPGWTENRPLPSDLYYYLNQDKKQISIEVNGIAQTIQSEKGYLRIKQTWKKGDRISIDLPMPVRRVLSHDKIEENAGRVALERGPVVYCAEWIDNGGKALDLKLNDNMILDTEYRDQMLNGLTVIKGQYPDGDSLMAIPYYAWAHRGSGEMAVWLERKF